uniref:Myomesin 2a n=1 Tax=Callorhinchus milii TaxID=7868 RepID=A0A4W3JL77_CALMI
MASKVVPFYQSKHKHYDYNYRSLDTRSMVKQYSSSSRRSHEELHQASASKGMMYHTELRQMQQELSKSRHVTREQLDMLAFHRMVKERATVQRLLCEDAISRAPEFLVRLRSHTVWEKSYVKLFCTVQGFPMPQVRWYKDDVIIGTASEPGKYRIDSYYGVHSLEISRCEFSDTAQYTAVAFNIHGQTSTNATLIVKRESQIYKSVILLFLVPLLSPPVFTHIDVQFIEAFGVSFGTEGETMTLTCSMIFDPNLKHLQPDVLWYRNDVQIKESKWAEIHFADNCASITLPHLNKDDEGLYTLRLITRGGVTEHSAFVFVKDASAAVVGAPGAPMDIKYRDANKDYVILAWKPPNITKESPVIGYFVDRCEVGTDSWVQCNDAPIKICKYPVSGIYEGRSYRFRVRAVNKSGVSNPSRATDAVTALDPADLARLHTIRLDNDKQIVISKDDLEGDVKIPGHPTNVHAAETNSNYIVLSWDPPAPRGRESLKYYIEKTMSGSTSWQRINTEIAARSPRFAVFDLAEGKSYEFRVFAVNKFGMSEPSPSTGPVLVQDHIAIPSPPSAVRATRNTKHSVLVKWVASKEASELMGYYLDSCLVGTNNWEPCNHKPIKYTSFVVHGLTTGKKYIFRVKAVNAVGMSELSQESEPITVQAALTSPSSPYGITLLDCTNDCMTLGWKAPRYTGGSGVTGYYMDHREVSHINWHESNIKAITSRAENLTEGSFYEFKLSAMNIAGLSLPSEPSHPMKCEAWTMPEPGPTYDLTFCEIRRNSLVILWKAPIYTGNSDISGYFVDICEAGSKEWRTVNQKSTSNRYLKVTELEEGKTYIFKVRAVNAAGPGKASEPSEPIVVQFIPGTKEIAAGVDEEGNIYLKFECQDMSAASQFAWSKSYEKITEFSKLGIETKDNKLVFTHPDMEDLGTYSVMVTDTDGISSSYVLAAEEMERLLALRHEIRHPTIPLKCELSYEVFERGQVRFWLQVEGVSSEATCSFIVNDMQMTDTTHKIGFDKSTGVIEMVMEEFTSKSEGTYTVQIQDGKAKNQSSLVLIGETFKAALAEADFQKKEYLRKQGPHFAEFMHWDVTQECFVELICKVRENGKQSFNFSKNTMAEYKMTLKDARGHDVTTLNVSGKGTWNRLLYSCVTLSGESASQLKIQCTPEGIRLQASVKYYMEDMKVFWYHKESKIASSEKCRIGGSSEQVWLHICDPADRDKGKYVLEIFDGKQSYKRSLDLSGDGKLPFCTLRDKMQIYYSSSYRGKVLGGLPDVVTIMEDKTLSLTSTVFGDPIPEVTWLKNDKEIELNDHYIATLEQGKFASLTIKGVTTEDSGKYGINVRNKFGGETIDITVSVYKHGDPIPEVKRGDLRSPESPKAKTEKIEGFTVIS